MTRRTTLTVLDIDSAPPDGAALLKDTRAAMGMVPNMYGAMANLPALLDTYLHGYHQFRAAAGFDPIEQEVVFLTVSRANNCHYCMAAHSFVADQMSKVPTAVTDALRNDDPIPEPKLAALARFTRHTFDTRGMPAAEELDTFRSAGYTDLHVLGVVLAIAVKTISNYTNHLFDTEVDAAFAGRSWPGPTASAS